MDAIGEDDDADALTTEIGDASTGPAVHASSRGRVRGRGHCRGYGGRGSATAREPGYGDVHGGSYQHYSPRCTSLVHLTYTIPNEV